MHKMLDQPLSHGRHLINGSYIKKKKKVGESCRYLGMEAYQEEETGSAKALCLEQAGCGCN